MGYDVEFIQVSVPKGTAFPVEADKAKTLRKAAAPFDDANVVRDLLLGMKGFRPGPTQAKDAVDFLGTGLSYARFFMRKNAIHVENNCGARDLLQIYGELKKTFPSLTILDLQSGQLHDAASFQQWWSRPLT